MAPPKSPSYSTSTIINQKEGKNLYTASQKKKAKLPSYTRSKIKFQGYISKIEFQGYINRIPRLELVTYIFNDIQEKQSNTVNDVLCSLGTA